MIHKAAGIIIRDRQLLVEKSFGKSFYISPGGSVEDGETERQALVRELMEEFSITVLEEDLDEFGTFVAEAAGRPGVVVQMGVFIINTWEGEPTASSEVEKIAWITSDFGDLPVGSIFADKVIPLLKERDLID